MQLAIAGAKTEGLYYKAEAFDWNESILVTITDASWAGETKIVGDQVFPRRSQMGRLTVLASPNIWDDSQAEARMHVIGWKSSMIKRVCRSTMQAETQAMIAGTEEGSRIRAAVADMRGKVEKKRWEISSSKVMKHLWVTDCDSLKKYLTNPTAAGTEDKRLEIDLEDLRQILWEDEFGNPKDDLGVDQTDKIIWIDTSAMLADPLTKVMKPTRLLEALETGRLTFEATAESQLTKLRKQKIRMKKNELAMAGE